MREITSLKCPNCGSTDTSIQQELKQGFVMKCAYCDTTSLVTVDDDGEAKGKAYIQQVSTKPAQPKMPRGAAEFGLKSGKLPIAAAIGALVLYLIGWFFEDTQYFLATEAMIIWVGILPLWLLGAALVWQTRQQVWWLGVGISILILLLHTAIPSFIRGRFNDDYLGIASMFAGAALAGWLLGRWLHWGIRLLRFRSDLQTEENTHA